MNESATELIDRLYKEVVAAVKEQKYESLRLDPDCITSSKAFQVRSLLEEMIWEESEGRATGSKELLNRVYNEITDAIKERNIETCFFDPTFRRYSKLAQVSYLLRVLLEDLQDC